MVHHRWCHWGLKLPKITTFRMRCMYMYQTEKQWSKLGKNHLWWISVTYHNRDMGKEIIATWNSMQLVDLHELVVLIAGWPISSVAAVISGEIYATIFKWLYSKYFIAYPWERQLRFQYETSTAWSMCGMKRTPINLHVILTGVSWGRWRCINFTACTTCWRKS